LKSKLSDILQPAFVAGLQIMKGFWRFGAQKAFKNSQFLPFAFPFKPPSFPGIAQQTNPPVKKGLL